MSDLPEGFMARVAELRRTEGIQRLVDEAPPLPQTAIDLLRAAGCPTGRQQPERGAA